MRKRKWIGDRAFYKMLLTVALPMLVQFGITNCVNLLDNVMVGQTGTEAMTGVAVVNTLINVFDICIFGVISGASIFGTQYFGSQNRTGFQNTFRFKIVYGLGAALLGELIFGFGGRMLIGMYLHEGSVSGDVAQTLSYGRSYLWIIMISLPVFALVQAYSSTLREMGKTVLPMAAGIAAIVINMVLNYILIFGKFGAPALGVEGAAIATVISRFAEFGIIAVSVHRRPKRYYFADEVYRKFRLPASLQQRIWLKGSPLIINEVLWATGTALVTQTYSLRGMAVVAGINICNVISSVFNIFFFAIGSAVSIIIGQLLGAGKIEEARDTDSKLIFTAVAGCAVLGVIMFLVAPLFPRIYNTTEEVRALATDFIRITALFIPVHAFVHVCYFTLRSGGRTFITLLFDSVYIWVISVPLSRALTLGTSLDIVQVFFLCSAAEASKCILGFFLIRGGVWAKNLTGGETGKAL